jgi:pimeloyl-ACP methyl ester carboxylesterase
MLAQAFDRFWHQRLGRPYRLQVGIDQCPDSCDKVVVLLHGIGSSSQPWQPVAELLDGNGCRVIAFDLLGFGHSPKPAWPEYNVDDHARAVIAAIDRRHIRGAVLVGHSMGCLIAVHIAKLRPDLVRGLVLYQPPLYDGLPPTRRYVARRDFYYRLYAWLIDESTASPSRLRQVIMKRTGVFIDPSMLQPFLKSLGNTIMRQTTLADMRGLRVPIDVIYGSLDVVVIRGRSKAVFNGVRAPLTTHTIAEFHGISKRAGRFIAKRIMMVLDETA